MLRLSSRRALWAPALILAGAAAGIAAMLGLTSALRTWPLWVLGFAALIGAVAWLDRRLQAPPPVLDIEVDHEHEHEHERRRGKGGASSPKQAAYDLERDRSTDKQRYLM
jgi:hypothetical protein